MDRRRYSIVHRCKMIEVMIKGAFEGLEHTPGEWCTKVGDQTAFDSLYIAYICIFTFQRRKF